VINAKTAQLFGLNIPTVLFAAANDVLN